MKQAKVLQIIHRYKLPLIGILVGCTGGYLYYYFVGCADGTCAITSSPVNSTLYGGLMGGLLFDMFNKKENE